MSKPTAAVALASFLAVCFSDAPSPAQTVGATSSTSTPQRAKAKKTAPDAGKAAEPRDLEVIDAARYLALVTERRGKPLMVALWATWCEPCREEYPMVNDLARKYAGKGLTVFGLSLDEDAEVGLVRRFLARTKPVFPNFRKRPGKDEEFINQVNARWSGTLPATFFYARDGRLVAQIVGEHPRETFEANLDKLLAAP